jgi:shikimate kinase
MPTKQHIVPCAPLQVLIERVDSIENGIHRQNGMLQEVRTELSESRKERYEQVEKVRIDLTAKISSLISTLVGLTKWIVGTAIAVGALAVGIIKLFN